MSSSEVTRRRALRILAAGAASCLPFGAAPGVTGVEWSGTALGADARILLLTADRALGEAAIEECLAEIARLERIFSLYQVSSELAQLNVEGRLRAPSIDLTELVRLSLRLNALTEGLFDPTVQPLWSLYADWQSGRIAPERLEALRTALRPCLGIGRISLGPGEIRIAAGSALTLNGVAQGYITDRIGTLLRARGWSNVLLDLGEVLALDGRPDGTPFTIGVRESGLRLPLWNAALATSAVGGLTFSNAPDGPAHILHPRTGLSPRHWRSVTVRHASAALADGLSTALAIADPEQLRRIVARASGVHVWATANDGASEVVKS